MKSTLSNIGIIDIGSNSIRVVVYEISPEGFYRVILESKESARLSEKIDLSGSMTQEGILSIVPVLREFKNICDAYQCSSVRCAATAAIRNAVNATEIVEMLDERTGLAIELLSGEEEAYYGFLGVAHGMPIENGFIIDIGGGSTEITLYRNRELQKSVSLPIGAVNSNARFGPADRTKWSEESIHELCKDVGTHLKEHAWIKEHAGLPMIGLGGTIRSLGKLDQRRNKYPLPMTHHYVIRDEDVDHYAELLPSLSVEQRKRLNGLSKNRVDLIVPGVLIFHTVLKYLKSEVCMISGTGLREGLLQDRIGVQLPRAKDVIKGQVNGLLAFHSSSPRVHLDQVHTLAQGILRSLVSELKEEDEEAELERLIYVSSMLYRIGSSLWYHQYEKHTFYWLLNAPLGALTHREVVMIALIAEYRAAKGKQLSTDQYQEHIITDEDAVWIPKLSTLLQLAIALDVTETQPVVRLEAEQKDGVLLLKLKCRAQPFVELKELEAAAKHFQKVWDIKLKWEIDPSSTS
ncbi:exopolyphosphatase/guanosine-5'-triphosphate,3'-diphosphate pyrophosphatase [Paenibacillus shirakamiensis]|uniref:Exopolyphosphatase/guanosine-5'-triphosphate, 3'-diphosphate pyrophosphatase n=1 Tax=Paenibacillus shirakamiensis TaxID=1265935 RepID=A0ABS4JBH3_9BACL|nr:Ppx/GppA family phosphatase [Paenibacillus shirakamiensis]MBP1999057.1 exopolyphosphatase/guanosine-5'-triphosphate,3'-diphosphate pyrophosphatase [Paenibacillus shirakamiensis]